MSQWRNSRDNTVTVAAVLWQITAATPSNPPPTTTHNRFILLFYALYISSSFDLQILLDGWVFPRKSALFYFLYSIRYQSKSKYNHIYVYTLRLIPSFNVRQGCIPITRLLLWLFINILNKNQFQTKLLKLVFFLGAMYKYYLFFMIKIIKYYKYRNISISNMYFQLIP